MDNIFKDNLQCLQNHLQTRESLGAFDTVSHVWLIHLLTACKIYVNPSQYLMTNTGHFVGASLVELEVALRAVEAIEEQSPTALAEREREESLAGELVRYVGHYRQLVECAYCHLAKYKTI